MGSTRALRLTAANNTWAPAFLHKDHLGSVRAISGAGGAVEERTLYRPYGAQRETASAIVNDDKSWLGERYDAGAGLQYLNARYYDPELAMFLQPDWFEVMQPGVGTNRYSYSLGDPVNKADPGGNGALGETLSDFFESLFSGLGLGGNHSSADAAENASKVGAGIANAAINSPIGQGVAITAGVAAGVTAVAAVAAGAELAAVAAPTAYALGLEFGIVEATGMTVGVGVVAKGVSELAGDALAAVTRGTPQVTRGAQGAQHATESMAEVSKVVAQNGADAVKAIDYNRALSSIFPGVSSKARPDAVVQLKSGVTHIIEVVSKSQSARSQRDKLDIMARAIGGTVERVLNLELKK